MNTDESLLDVLSLINQQHKDYDMAVVTGDLVNFASPSAYQRLHDTLFQNLSSPFAWLPGNHDNNSVMEEFGSKVNLKLHTLGNWLVVLLDSHVDGQVHGSLSEGELQFLEQALSNNTDKHVVIGLHHQPVPIGSQWIDAQAVDNANSFWKLVDRFPQVKVVIWGHVHQQFEMYHNEISLLSAPSTCIQFVPGKKEFGLENMMPGYRWFELNSDGSFCTGVERVLEKDYGTDLDSEGY